MKTEAAEKHRHLEESHRQEMERLQARYQESLAETEERCGAEVAMLRRQLQELSGLQAQDRCDGSIDRNQNIFIHLLLFNQNMLFFENVQSPQTFEQ